MLYAAKCYWPGVTQAGLEQVAERARAGLGAGSGSVIYLGSLLFATDDLVLCPRERLMEPMWLPSDQPIPEGAQR